MTSAFFVGSRGTGPPSRRRSSRATGAARAAVGLGTCLVLGYEAAKGTGSRGGVLVFPEAHPGRMTDGEVGSDLHGGTTSPSSPRGGAAAYLGCSRSGDSSGGRLDSRWRRYERRIEIAAARSTSPDRRACSSPLPLALMPSSASHDVRPSSKYAISLPRAVPSAAP